MSRSHLILSISSAILIAAIGTASAESTTSEPVGSYRLKRKSSFNSPEETRVPFWPIGHVKQKPVEAKPDVPVEPTIILKPEMFAVTSIVLGHPSLAIINGRAYGEGETIRMPKATAAAQTASKGAAPVAALDPRIRVRVARIQDGTVTLQTHNGQSVTVGLKRPELPQHQSNPDELLLDEDR